MAAPEDSPRNLVLNGIFAGALFGLVMIGGHLWAVARAGDEIRVTASATGNMPDAWRALSSSVPCSTTHDAMNRFFSSCNAAWAI